MVKNSIIIPTCYDYKGNLRNLLESLLQYTSFEETELIIVNNGLADFDKEDYELLVDKYVDNPENIKMIMEPEPVGYPRAINLGIEGSSGEYIILLNDDTKLQPQEKDTWIKMLVHPFSIDPRIGLTGP